MILVFVHLVLVRSVGNKVWLW